MICEIRVASTVAEIWCGVLTTSVTLRCSNTDRKVSIAA